MLMTELAQLMYPTAASNGGVQSGSFSKGLFGCMYLFGRVVLPWPLRLDRLQCYSRDHQDACKSRERTAICNVCIVCSVCC